MATLHRKLLRVFSILLVILVIVSVIWPFVSIQLRLSRNGKIAHQLVESLEARFPGSQFGGAASYESEIIYITALNRFDEAERQDVETWLRKQQIEQKIAPGSGYGLRKITKTM